MAALALFLFLDELNELRICWKDEEKMNVTVHGTVKSLHLDSKFQNEIRKGWHNYCFAVKTNNGGHIKVNFLNLIFQLFKTSN